MCNGNLTFSNLEENTEGYLMFFPKDYQKAINVNISAMYKYNVLDFNNIQNAQIYLTDKVGKVIELAIETILCQY
jgi:hypothetical protein